ncbi:MAG: DUF2520 domain-containing protein [Lachnospiraceae bacterium]|nr:DUF2520 domain-containing protein [Lachnospiraceae bacterium]
MNIGFVGAGKVGCSIAKLLAQREKCVSGFYSRSHSSAMEAAEFVGTTAFDDINQLLEVSDVLFLTVPDGAVATVYRSLNPNLLVDKIICHCSGALSTAVFEGIEKWGASAFSVHPFVAISSRYESYQYLPNSIFTLEGKGARPEHKEAMLALLRDLDLRVEEISGDAKVAYHGAAVMASNLMLGLLSVAKRELVAAGFSEEGAEAAILSLAKGNLGNALNAKEQPFVTALTGPIQRGDAATVAGHLQAFSGDTREIYRLLSKEVLQLARAKNSTLDDIEIVKLLYEEES